ncbi:MAG: hypothetical protein FWD38_06290 [Oscillospiraceae bacterium]|nr:hypothetical protein [Oscillospiraceae bacterium]
MGIIRFFGETIFKMRTATAFLVSILAGIIVVVVYCLLVEINSGLFVLIIALAMIVIWLTSSVYVVAVNKNLESLEGTAQFKLILDRFNTHIHIIRPKKTNTKQSEEISDKLAVAYKILYTIVWICCVVLYIVALYYYGIIKNDIQGAFVVIVLVISFFLNYFSSYYCLCVVKLIFDLWIRKELTQFKYNELVPSNTKEFRLIKIFSSRISVIFSVVSILYLLMHIILLTSSGMFILNEDFNIRALAFQNYSGFLVLHEDSSSIILLLGLMFPFFLLLFLSYIFLANRFLVYAVHKEMIEESIARKNPYESEDQITFDDMHRYIDLSVKIRRDRRPLNLSSIAGILISIASIIASILVLSQHILKILENS